VAVKLTVPVDPQAVWFDFNALDYRFETPPTPAQATTRAANIATSPQYLRGFDYLLFADSNGKNTHMKVSGLLACELTKNASYTTRLLPRAENLPDKAEWLDLITVYLTLSPTADATNCHIWFGRIKRLFRLRKDEHFLTNGINGKTHLYFSFAKFLFGRSLMAEVHHSESPLKSILSKNNSNQPIMVELIGHTAEETAAIFAPPKKETVNQPSQKPKNLLDSDILPTPPTPAPFAPSPSPEATAPSRPKKTTAPRLVPDDPSNITQEDLDNMHIEEMVALEWRLKWMGEARAKQITPSGKWTKLLYLCGRGWGKTRCGAEAAAWYAYKNPGSYITVIAPTANDIRKICFEGESGLYAVLPPELIASGNRSLNEIVLKNGSKISGTSAEEPERLRGLQHNFCWGDESAAWGGGNPVKAREVYDMMMFGLRLGTNPQVVFTTTPKPIPLVRKLIKDAETDSTVLVVRGNTYENKDNLAPNFFKEIAQYEGTQLGRQEIHAEVLDPEESGIIKRSWFKLWPSKTALPKFEYIIQSYDTAFTDKTENDPTACSTWGVFQTGGVYSVLLCDFWTDHLTFDDLRERMIDEFDSKYGDSSRRPDIILIEDKGSGISIRQSLQKAGLPVRAYNPGRADKTQRLHVVSHLIANGHVWLPESEKFPGEPRTWVAPFVEQVCSFPLVEHDDAVDTMTQALKLLNDQSWLSVREVEEEEPEDIDYEEQRHSRENPYAC
jgi:predicted phage terminase large subunit-like protein